MRLTLLALLFAFVWGQDDERLDFSDATDRVESDEEVVEGTISLNGTVTPDSASKLNWAAQNALIQACGSGSKVIAYTILQLTGTSERRGVDVKFFVLPRLGGGGDCARTLVEGSAGGFEPPFPPSGAKRKPIFRTMMETELDLLGFRDFLSDFYLRLWRVTCGTRPVWRNRISHSELNAVTVCSTYANGWGVYLEASLTEPATATGFFLGYSAGNADSGALQGFSDPCFVANSPCFCSSLANCGWRPREDGVGRQCRTLEAGDTQKPVACSHCQHQPGCPPSCAAESTACNCASIAATCHWDVETSECKEGGASGVPCTSCSFQEKCDELRPRAEQFRPETIFAMSRVGPKSLIEVDFDMPLKLPGVAARGAARFLCGRDGLPPAANSLYLQEYVVPGDAFLVEGRTLKLASGAVRVLEPTRCTMVFDDGVVQSAEGLPSKPVGFGEFYFNMKDSFPPEVAEFYPQNGAGDVPVTVPLLQVTFKERVRATEQFAAHLTHTDLFGSRKAAPKQLSLESVKERAVNLRLDGVLAPGRFYELTIDPGSIIDYGSLEYVGLSAGSYKFKTEGEFQEVQVIDGSMAYRLPGYAVAGIIVGSVLLVATGLFLCYRGYVAASEKDDVQAFEDEVGGASEDKRKQPVPIFHEDAIRDMQIDQLPETPDARKQGAILYAFEDEQQLEEGLKTKPQLLDAVERPVRGHKPHSHLRPQPRPLSLKKAPEKEPPKLKPGFFLRDADT